MAGLAPTAGLAGTPGLAGILGFGLGAGAGPLFPMTLFGRDPPGVEVGLPLALAPALPFIRPLSAAARAAAPPPALGADGVALDAGVGRAGGGLAAGGGGGGAARSMSLRLA